MAFFFLVNFFHIELLFLSIIFNNYDFSFTLYDSNRIWDNAIGCEKTIYTRQIYYMTYYSLFVSVFFIRQAVSAKLDILLLLSVFFSKMNNLNNMLLFFRLEMNDDRYYYRLYTGKETDNEFRELF